MRIPSLFASLFALLLPEPVPGQESAGLSASAGWTSRYVSEGRNNLADGGMVEFQGEATHGRAALIVWYAHADTDDYNELNVSVGYGLEAGPVAVGLSATRLEFFKADESDNEFAVSLEGSLPRGVQLFGEGVYSTEARGAFLVFGARRPFALLDGHVDVAPYVLEGLDFDYASPLHNGPNHFEAGVEASAPLAGTVTLNLLVLHSWAQKDVSREGLGNQFTASIGLQTSF